MRGSFLLLYVVEIEIDLIPSEDESGSGSDDTRSHTSLEEVDKLDPNILLYKVAILLSFNLCDSLLAQCYSMR